VDTTTTHQTGMKRESLDEIKIASFGSMTLTAAETEDLLLKKPKEKGVFRKRSNDK
jgi:hypothetical protein